MPLSKTSAVAPDVQQLQAWVNSRRPPPDAEALAAYGRALGARRVKARAEVSHTGRHLKLIIPLLYRAGHIEVLSLARMLQVSRATVNKALTDAGMPPSPNGHLRMDTAEDDAEDAAA